MTSEPAMQRSGNDRFFSPFGEWKSDKNNARFGQLTNTLSSGISLRRFYGLLIVSSGCLIRVFFLLSLFILYHDYHDYYIYYCFLFFLLGRVFFIYLFFSFTV